MKLGYGDQQEISGAITVGTSGATWFGFPAIEVNDKGDVVAAYQGTSPKIFPDARCERESPAPAASVSANALFATGILRFMQ